MARLSDLVFPGAMSIVLGFGVGVVAQSLGYPGWMWGSLAALLTAAVGSRRLIRQYRARQQPPTPAMQAWLREHIRWYCYFDAAERQRYEAAFMQYLADHTFEGVRGATVDPEHTWAVAAAGALMLHGRPDWPWPAQRSIVFLPDRFDDGYFSGGHDADFDGMVHAQGSVLLSIPSVEDAWDDDEDGSNVILHELAHVLDFHGGYAEGVPGLMDRGSVPAWEALVDREMRRIRQRASLIRPYGATNPAEFFATSVENFFERPNQLRSRHRSLFDALVALFQFDPRLPDQVTGPPADS
ncbi:MAG: zinc-dependent peptidase [Bacteroidota bacterium]